MSDKQLPDFPAPIFVISYRLSGSALLGFILDTHTEICSPGELHLGRFCEDLTHVIDLLSTGKVSEATTPDVRQLAINEEVRRRVSELMRTHVAKKGKRMWCDNTRRNINFLPLLAEIFPDAKYICLYRNCMDVVNSCLGNVKLDFHETSKYYMKKIPTSYVRSADNEAGMFADNWADVVTKMLAFEREHPERCFRLKYESLVADPRAALGPVFESLGVKWDERLPDEILSPAPVPENGDIKLTSAEAIGSKNAGERSGVSPRMIPAKVLERVNSLLEELEYPPIGYDWETSPPPVPEPVLNSNGKEDTRQVSRTDEVFTSSFPRRVKDSPAPVFVLSCERSGSTLLRYIIDTHPEMCSPGELHLGKFCESFGHIADLLSIGRVSEAEHAVHRRELVNAEVRQMVCGLMEAYAGSKGKRMWCEKTPSNVDFLSMLRDIFPDAKYICLHRNCMDVVHSCLQKPKFGLHVALKHYAKKMPTSSDRSINNKSAMFADSWADKTSKLLAFEREHPQQCFHLKYESLVTEPATVLQAMFEFLGVEWDEGLLDAVFKSKHDPGPGDINIMYSNKISAKSIGRGSSIARRLIPDEVLGRVNAVLEELAYPVIGPDWDASPSPYLPAVQPAEENKEGEVISDIREVFTSHFPRRMRDRSDRLKEFSETCKFVVTGDAGGVWLVDPSEPGGQIRAEDSEAGCTITISASDLVAMVNGKLNPALAYGQGKVSIAGNVRQAMGIGQLLLSV